MTRPAAFVVALLVGLVVLIGGAAPAWAHAELSGTSPVAGAVLDAPPDAMELRFSEPVDPVPGGIRLLRSDASEVPVGPVGRIDGDASSVRLPVATRLGAGTYVVSWRVTSADSHPVRGAFTFQVGDGPRAEVAPLVERMLADQGGRPGVGAVLAVGRWLSFAGVTLSAGWLLFVALGLAPAVPVGAVWRAAAVGVAGTLVMVVGQVANVAGTWSVSTRAGAYTDVFATRSGAWWLARLVLLAGLTVGAAVAARRRAGGGGGGGVAVGVAGVAFAVVLCIVTASGGHAATGRWVAVGVAATVAHLLALGLWAAGLVTLALGRGPAADGRSDFALRFSPWALAAVLVLIGSGLLNSARQLGDLSALTSTDYGRLLLVKLGVVAVLLAVAAVTRRRARGRSSAEVGAAVGAEVGAGRGRLFAPVLVEVALVGVALAVTAVLVNVRPALGEREAPVSAVAVVGERTAQVVLDPARTGGATLHVYLSSPRGTLDRAREIGVSATLAAQDIGPLPIEVFPSGPNHVTNPDVVLPLPGEWTIEVVARYGEFEEVRFRTTLRVRG